ncbi:MAG: Flp pilus assembly protein TadD, partial [Marivirga sp.]
MRKLLMLLCLFQLSCGSVEERQNTLIQKGLASTNEGQYNRAVDYFDDAIALEPSNELAWNAKGVALYKDGQPYEAVHAFDKAIQIKPDFTRA